MNQTITINKSVYKDLASRLDRVEKLLNIVVAKLEQEPPENTLAWWQWSVIQGRKAYKEKKYALLKDKKDIEGFFTSL